MDTKRHSEWIESSMGLMHVEMLLVGNAQGLGLIDMELIQDFPKINFQLEKERLKKLKHITLSELWVMGAYELVRLIDEIVSKKQDKMNVETIKKIKETLSLFLEIRVPLVKFQKAGQGELFSGIASKCEFDKDKGLGWKIIFAFGKKFETKIFYRKDLADNLLELLKVINKDIRARHYVARD